MDVLQQLTLIFRDYFEDDTIELRPSTTAGEIDGWDSLSHALLIATIENKFKIKFGTRELLTFDNVGDLVSAIQSKL